MDFVIPLDKMTIKDKLTAMEQLWENLCRTPNAIPSPPWHEDVLIEREKQVSEGTAKFSSLAEVKDRLRKSTK